MYTDFVLLFGTIKTKKDGAEMDFHDYKIVKLTDIANIERAVKGKIYPEGSIKIQLSATKGAVEFQKQCGEIESKYAVVEPKTNINKRYLFTSIEKSFPEFYHRFIADINLQIESLNFFEICIHNSLETQEYIAKVAELNEKEILKEQMIIESYKNIKKNFMNNMFC